MNPTFCSYCGRILIEHGEWHRNRKELWLQCPRYRRRYMLLPGWSNHTLHLALSGGVNYDPVTGDRR